MTRSGPLRPLMLCAALALACTLGGCGSAEPEPESADVTDESAQPDAEPEVAAETGARRFLPDRLRRSTRAETFPHDGHVEISCAVCHERVEGHGSHAQLDCAECHRSSELATRETLDRAECLGCHHDASRGQPCVSCHETVEPRVMAGSLRLAVWEEGRERDLTFEHPVHGALECGACHQDRPFLRPTRTCASCHDEHHGVSTDCSACHVPPPAGTHDLDAHRGCSSSGCHVATVRLTELPPRAGCTVCHDDQVDHEPEQPCSLCHQVAGAYP